MNMMSLRERQEDEAVPDFVRQLRADDVADDASDETSAAAQHNRIGILERLTWFRNLSLANKINTIFGTFLGVGVLMTLVLGLGLGQLWNRYQSTARVQDALMAALSGARG